MVYHFNDSPVWYTDTPGSEYALYGFHTHGPFPCVRLPNGHHLLPEWVWDIPHHEEQQGCCELGILS